MKNTIQRSASTEDLRSKDKYLYDVKEDGYIKASDIPVNSDIDHFKFSGILRKSGELRNWKVFQSKTSIRHLNADFQKNSDAIKIQYVSMNGPGTKLEFGFSKVDAAARDALCRHFAAINKLMEEKSICNAQNSDCHVPCFFLHENHFPSDFNSKTDKRDFEHYHGNGLMHLEDQQATHYHFYLGWRKFDKNEGVLLPAKQYLPDAEKVKEAAAEYVPLLLNILKVNNRFNDSVFKPADNMSQRFPLGKSSSDNLARLAKLVGEMPTGPVHTTYYDRLAEEGFCADQGHLISMNLERTPAEIYAFAESKVLGLPIDEYKPSKRKPDFKEFSDLYARVKDKSVLTADLQNTESVPVLLNRLKEAMKR